MSADPSVIEPAAAASRARVAVRSRFFLGMTLAMAFVVVAGFTPTLFGRAAFNVPKMPGYLYVHGIVLASWFALLVAQAALVGSNLALHRRLGWAALAFLILIPIAGMGTQLALPARARGLGVLESVRELIQTIFWLNLFSTLEFIGFAGAALWLRRRADTHKRLMLFASIALILPAAARLSRWPIFGNTAPDMAQPSSTGNDVLFSLGTMLLLVGAVIVNDLLTKRRVHRVTVIGSVVIVGMALLVPVFASAEWAKAVVWALS